MKRLIDRTALAIAGLLLLVIGVSLVLQPVDFAAANGVALAQDPSTLSEYRAPGGLLLTSAAVILLGIFDARVTRLALALAALVYCSYGASRVIGMLIDGLPSSALTQATVIELTLGSLCLLRLSQVGQHDEKRAPR